MLYLLDNLSHAITIFLFRMVLLILAIYDVNHSAYNCQDSPKDGSGLLKAVQNVHSTIDKEIAAGINPNNIFVCGFSQGGLYFISRVYEWICACVCTYLSLSTNS